ncbi:hypothetical protein O3P69_017379 [Scylla paramamosain]|uniref:Secreted protein n=1 Tax=Scylla paramamosain TaxID=85552 RepID=A0AAW0SGE6_SCYPA
MAAVVAVVPALKYWHCSGRSGSKKLAVQECLYLDSTQTRKLKILRLPLLRLLQRLGQRAAWLHHLGPWLNTGREGSVLRCKESGVIVIRCLSYTNTAAATTAAATKKEEPPDGEQCARLATLLRFTLVFILS